MYNVACNNAYSEVFWGILLETEILSGYRTDLMVNRLKDNSSEEFLVALRTLDV